MVFDQFLLIDGRIEIDSFVQENQNLQVFSSFRSFVRPVLR